MDAMNLMELFRLAEGLQNKGIPFEFISSAFCNGAQICVPNRENCEWDAICNEMSYGHKEGLLEIMGTITKGDDVEGSLTAEEILDRL